jgi:hypothetical protein
MVRIVVCLVLLWFSAQAYVAFGQAQNDPLSAAKRATQAALVVLQKTDEYKAYMAAVDVQKLLEPKPAAK